MFVGGGVGALTVNKQGCQTDGQTDEQTDGRCWCWELGTTLLLCLLCAYSCCCCCRCHKLFRSDMHKHVQNAMHVGVCVCVCSCVYVGNRVDWQQQQQKQQHALLTSGTITVNITYIVQSCWKVLTFCWSHSYRSNKYLSLNLLLCLCTSNPSDVNIDNSIFAEAIIDYVNSIISMTIYRVNWLFRSRIKYPII